MNTLAAGLPQLTATVGTSLEAIGEALVVAHPSRDDLTHAEAAALTAEIRGSLRGLAEMVEAVGHLVTAAWAMRADCVLGYESWAAYCEHLFADVRATRMPVDTRRAVVVALRSAGMSTRAAGSVLGVHHDTVASDLRATVGDPTDQPASVTGLDGRRRPAAAPAKAPAPRRTKTAITLELLEAAGEDGLTWVELGRRMRWRGSIPSATLTRLERQQRVRRTGQVRDGCGVYVATKAARIGA